MNSLNTFECRVHTFESNDYGRKPSLPHPDLMMTPPRLLMMKEHPHPDLMMMKGLHPHPDLMMMKELWTQVVHVLIR